MNHYSDILTLTFDANGQHSVNADIFV